MINFLCNLYRKSKKYEFHEFVILISSELKVYNKKS